MGIAIIGVIVAIYLLEAALTRLQNATKAAVTVIAEVVTGLVFLAALLGLLYVGYAFFLR